MERCIQRAIVAPLYQKITQTISPITSQKDELLKTRKAELKGKDQNFYFIKEEYQASDNWASPILELNQIPKTYIPFDKVSYLLAASRAIYNTVRIF